MMNRYIAVLWVICLLASQVGIFMSEAKAASDREHSPFTVDKSVKDNGIRLSINTVKYENKALIVEYTVKSKQPQTPHYFTLIQKPDVMINGKPYHSSNMSYHEKDKNTYYGKAKIIIQKELPEHLSVSFNTDSIFGEEGQWTVMFAVPQSEIYNPNNHETKNK